MLHGRTRAALSRVVARMAEVLLGLTARTFMPVETATFTGAIRMETGTNGRMAIGILFRDRNRTIPCVTVC